MRLSKLIRWWWDRRSLARLLRGLPTHFAGIGSMSTIITAGFQVTNASNTQVGAAYQPLATSVNIQKKWTTGTTLGNAVAGGGDEVFSFQQAITAGSSATVNLQAMTNLCQQANSSIARVKGLVFRLLSGADDSIISPTPNANSQVVVTNNGPALPAPLYWDLGGSGLTLTLTVGGGGTITAVSIGAAGSGYMPSSVFVVGPNQAGGSGALISVTTNASGVPTAVAVVAGGSGYSAATVPSTVLGHNRLTTGNATCYVDVTSLGTAIDSTHQNIKIFNLDGANAVTVELDFIGATT